MVVVAEEDATCFCGLVVYVCIYACMYVWQVFRTKARAPSLMVCVVRRDDLSSAEHYSLDTADYLEAHFAREVCEERCIHTSQ